MRTIFSRGVHPSRKVLSPGSINGPISHTLAIKMELRYLCVGSAIVAFYIEHRRVEVKHDPGQLVWC